MFLIFDSQSQAQEICDRISLNIRQWIKENLPIRVFMADLISTDVKGNPQPAVCKTITWDVPKQCIEGWVIVKPEQKDLGQIPIDVALLGVQAQEMEVVHFIPNE